MKNPKFNYSVYETYYASDGVYLDEEIWSGTYNQVARHWDGMGHIDIAEDSIEDLLSFVDALGKHPGTLQVVVERILRVEARKRDEDRDIADFLDKAADYFSI